MPSDFSFLQAANHQRYAQHEQKKQYLQSEQRREDIHHISPRRVAFHGMRADILPLSQTLHNLRYLPNILIPIHARRFILDDEPASVK